MANEYLKRTPTSTGNRTTWSFSFWVKITGRTGIVLTGFGAYKTGTTQGDDIFFRTGTGGAIRYTSIDSGSGSSYLADVLDNAYKRDNASWMHVLAVANTTAATNGSDRWHLYVNGARITDTSTNTYPAVNYLTNINNIVQHYIGGTGSGGSSGQLFDTFFVDGQALTPDVFGFYKDGDGYMSSGTTQATDFRPGQWMPHSPAKIKKDVNRRGGFGVNGFYLPMNDSSNPGADFHCAPNSIIKLKGEDLPQPRNGAPTTSDAYVSELRSDPYAANLVLAVPGISTATGANLVTNGHFDTDTSGWSSFSSATLTQVNGTLKVECTGGDTVSAGSYNFATVNGQRYTVSVEVISRTGTTELGISNNSTVGAGANILSTNDASASLDLGLNSRSFTATGTTTYIGLWTSGIANAANTNAVYDNVIVKQEDVPIDYSADIKGSGTNKTLTANGNVGVGYELGGYYGSAMTFDGTGDFLSIPNNSDFNYSGGEDFTIELWLYRKDTGGNDAVIGVFENSVARRAWQLEQRANQAIRFEWWSNGSSGTDITTANNTVPIDQWSHICVERSGNVITVYVNGVAVGINVSAGSIYNNTADPLRIGVLNAAVTAELNANIQDVRIYKGVAKYKGGFDVPKPYTPVSIEAFRTTTDTCKNNFATLNPLVGAGIAANDNAVVLRDGNLYYDNANQSWTISTIGVSSGKYYAEFMCLNGSFSSNIGVCGDNRHGRNNQQYHAARGISYIRLASTAVKKDYNTIGATEEVDAAFSYESGSIVGITIDFDNKEIKYYKNGTLIRTDSTPASYTPVDFAFYFLAFRTNDGANPVGSSWSDVVANFGQNPTFSGTTTAGTNADDSGKGLFKYAPPSGFLALCEDNLPTPAIADPGKHFKTVLYTGDGNNGRSITGVGFQPDLIWLKNRSSSNFHVLCDSVRGLGNLLFSNSTQQEDNYSGGTILSFDSDGYSVNHNSNANSVNVSGGSIVAWCWKAGGAAVSNSDGSITSQVSVNQDAGFSIVSYTGTGANATVGHGLNKTPKFIITKQRTTAGHHWRTYHSSIGATKSVYLNLNNAESGVDAGFMNSTEPTTSVFSIGTDTNINESSQAHIAYCWAEIEGFSKFGSYVGNGNADGPFVYCGFKPAWVMFKNSSIAADWDIHDSSRDSTNPTVKRLWANLSSVETTSSYDIDYLSNGFKIRNTNPDTNTNGNTIVFMAFAESPFQTANAK